MSPDTSWTFAPGPVLLVALLLGAYLWRWRDVRSSSSSPARDAPVWRLAIFLLGIALLAGALFSPLDVLG